MGYAIRLPVDRVLQDKIGHLLNRPAGRPSQEVRRYDASFQLPGRIMEQAPASGRQG